MDKYDENAADKYSINARTLIDIARDPKNVTASDVLDFIVLILGQYSEAERCKVLASIIIEIRKLVDS